MTVYMSLFAIFDLKSTYFVTLHTFNFLHISQFCFTVFNLLFRLYIMQCLYNNIDIES